MKKTAAILCALIFACFAQGACAAERGAAAAEKIGTMLAAELAPEKIEVTVAEDEKEAWVECTGALLSGIRVESLKLRAQLRKLPDANTAGGEALADLITASKGEMTLKVSDVNKYFAAGPEVRGFKELRFSFAKNGYTAKGVFEMNAVFITLKLNLMATGRLGLKKDGVYLEETELYAENIKQPQNITELVTGRVNPLLAFSKITFPVEFENITMNQNEAILTGHPQKIEKGWRWSWKK
ncbi:MAG: hypothetical protein RR501_05680 [Cloacibacillus sp.]